jgi:short-subunit dehydrogenase
VFETNVLGVYRTLRPFVPPMVARGSGRILVVSSVVGRRGTPNYSAYSASKFALHGMADALRVELHGSGVTVGVVCPSSTTTEFHASRLQQGPQQRRVRPMKHTAESVARALVRMSRSTRRETVLSVEGKLLVAADALAPGLLDRILARVLL